MVPNDKEWLQSEKDMKEWRAFLKEYGRHDDSGVDWYDRYLENHTKEQYPYSYSPFWVWRLSDKELKKSVTSYNDRMDFDLRSESMRFAAPGKRFENYTRNECSIFLSRYYEKNLKATGLVEGCNVSTGYPYYVFYYRPVRKKITVDTSE